MITNILGFVVFVIVLISGLFDTGAAVKITNVVVPSVTDANRPVVLDCDYTLDADDGALVVKWYFNDGNLVYQWISGHPPTAIAQPQYFEIKEKRLGPKKFEINCEVKGVFPRPTLSLKLGDRDLNGLKVEITPNQYIYDAQVTTVFYAKEDITEIECLVMVQEVNYLAQKKSIITVKGEIPGAAIAGADITRCAVHLLNLILLLVFII
uniref:Uncharacterized protein LOC114326307 isoform X2 n=1 Tax=Diabrotica virgifera virgifera TaxID=50390 RepID=A0A6P7F413_DIAVI